MPDTPDPLTSALREVDELDRAWHAAGDGLPVKEWRARIRAIRGHLALVRLPGHISWEDAAAVEAQVGALDAVAEMAETGGDIPTEVTIIQNRLRAILGEPHDA